jgi:hypothetical protein
MRRLVKQKKGQFIIIAVLLMAIMIVSIGALLYSAVTYYKHEPWEEYLTLIGNIELSARHLVELSLSNYTHTLNTNILKVNLEQWQSNLAKIYPGHGIALTYSLANGTEYNYSLGLAYDWNKTASFSAANATFDLDMASVGLTGYTFTATAFLNLTILNIDSTNNKINVTVTGEDGMPITNLKKDNFQVDGLDITSVTSRHDQNYILIYTITCETSPPLNATVRVWDHRGIRVIAKKA